MTEDHIFPSREEIKRLKVAVLCGGPSPEHEVSLASGKKIFNVLDRDKFEPELIIWERDDTPPVSGEEFRRFDLVFIAMHGPFGEDGTVQAFFELLDVPYTGSGVAASRLGMDKVASKLFFRSAGIPTPENKAAERVEQGFRALEVVGLPCVVKPSAQGSSVGVSIVRRRREFKEAFSKAIKFDGRAIVERYIEGREINAGILGNQKPIALPLIEIVPKREFFDYEAKYGSLAALENHVPSRAQGYDPALAEEITPAPLDRKITKEMQEMAVRAYQALGCCGFARVDMLLEEGGRIYVLEVNTIPGLTKNSLLPKEARAAGIKFPQLLEMIIDFALER